MFTHYVLTAVSYSEHCRFAFDIVGSVAEAQKLIGEFTKKNKHNLPFSLHVKKIKGSGIQDLIDADPYFKDMKFCDNLDQFLILINSDRFLTSTDISKYILSIKDYSKSELQKLVYFCYAEYLKETGKSLFSDQIYAFQYGPVAESLYFDTKEYNTEKLREKIIDNFDERSQQISECRIQKAEDGLDKLHIIDRTINQLGNLSVNDLVELSHEADGPWKRTYEQGVSWNEISDQTIKTCYKSKLTA